MWKIENVKLELRTIEGAVSGKHFQESQKVYVIKYEKIHLKMFLKQASLETNVQLP